jgi:nucleoside-diphosphate-sugar epimerase
MRGSFFWTRRFKRPSCPASDRETRIDVRVRLGRRPAGSGRTRVRLAASTMSAKRLAVLTGGTGFVGSHLAEALLAAGYRVRALVRRPASPGWLSGLDVEVAAGDVRDASSLVPFVDGADLVVHAAGKTAARSLAEYRASNAAGTRHLLDATLQAAPGAHFVLISSQAAAGPSQDGLPVSPEARGRPVSSYGWSKLEGEDELRARPEIAFTILRPSAVYGPRETAIRDLFVATARGVTPVLAGGALRVQLVYVGDVARAVLGAAARGGRRETFFLAHPEVLDYRSIAVVLSSLRTPPARLVAVPAAVIRAAGLATSLVSRFSKGPPVFNSEKASELLHSAWLCDVSSTQEALGSPLVTPFAAGARTTWTWYQDAGWLGKR